jgi:hypothetical protein
MMFVLQDLLLTVEDDSQLHSEELLEEVVQSIGLLLEQAEELRLVMVGAGDTAADLLDVSRERGQNLVSKEDTLTREVSFLGWCFERSVPRL